MVLHCFIIKTRLKTYLKILFQNHVINKRQQKCEHKQTNASNHDDFSSSPQPLWYLSLSVIFYHWDLLNLLFSLYLPVSANKCIFYLSLGYFSKSLCTWINMNLIRLFKGHVIKQMYYVSGKSLLQHLYRNNSLTHILRWFFVVSTNVIQHFDLVCRETK